MTESKIKRTLIYFIFKLVYIICVTGLLFWILSSYAYDDSYITYRYASQLAQGHGFVYNLGERVLSTTTPLFAVLLAIGSYAWADIPHLANLIGCLSVALSCLFLWELSRALKQPVVGWVGLLVLPTFPLLLRTMGSETSLYLAFCLGTFASYAHRRYNLTATLAALAVLTRGDGLLIAFVLAAHFILTKRGRIPWMAVGFFIGLLLPWFAFSWAYFGSPLPATLAAKQHQGSMAISQRFAAGFFTVIHPYLSDWKYQIEAVLAAIGLVYLGWRARPWGLILIWSILYFMAYSILGVSRYFWYYAPLVPGFVVLMGLGVESIVKVGGKLFRGLFESIANGQIAGRFQIILALILPLPLLYSQSQDVWLMRYPTDNRVEVYRAVGKWLQSNTPLDTTVGTLEVGIIGYYAQRSMVDFAGLLQPEVAAQLTYNATYEDAALWAVSRYHPQYLVLHDGVFPRLEQGYAANRCQPLKHFYGRDYGYDQNMTIYHCQ